MSIGIIGAGAWGTALAITMASDGTPVRLWAHEAEVVDAITRTRENVLYLPSVRLPASVAATTLPEDLADCEMLLVVTPAQHLRGVLTRMPVESRPLVLCAKGIEAGTAMLMTEVAAEVCPGTPVAVLSGPTFAHEVAGGLPTAVTLAAATSELAQTLCERLSRPALRPYASTDPIGAEIGGAVKNVLAIACGVVEGAGLGQNARAALIARGFAEMTRFGVARGARPETLAGLSGLGDLVLTCSSTSSRNFSLGKGLGEGRSAAELMADRRTVAEGAYTAPVLVDAAHAVGVDMPVAESVCALLDGSAGVREIVSRLLTRPIRAE